MGDMEPEVQRRNRVEPRSSAQYEIQTTLEYRIIRRKNVIGFGHGITESISRRRIVFRPEQPLPVGVKTEVYVDWPVPLENGVAIRLYVHGESQAAAEGWGIVKILRYEFRIAPRSVRLCRATC
jgi:hypothetical protein